MLTVPDPSYSLIRRLRERAHDPARCLDEVPVPIAAVLATTAPEYQQLREDARWGQERGMASLMVPAGSPAALDLLREVPRGPKFPPLTVAELRARECEIGVRLPDLLRRLYTEVADGGFGPAYGILGIGEQGHGDDYHRTADALYRGWREAGAAQLRLGWPVCYHGCAMYSFVSLAEHDGPVRLWDPSAQQANDRPETGVILTTPTLAEWLEDWLDGRDRLAELIGEPSGGDRGDRLVQYRAHEAQW